MVGPASPQRAFRSCVISDLRYRQVVHVSEVSKRCRSLDGLAFCARLPAETLRSVSWRSVWVPSQPEAAPHPRFAGWYVDEESFADYQKLGLEAVVGRNVGGRRERDDENHGEDR